MTLPELCPDNRYGWLRSVPEEEVENTLQERRSKRGVPSVLGTIQLWASAVTIDRTVDSSRPPAARSARH